MECLLGSAELWIPGTETLFAAPDLIVHYVREHRYLPPEAFRQASEHVELATWNPPKDHGNELLRECLAGPKDR